MPTPLPVLPGVYYGYLHGKTGGLTTGMIFTFKVGNPPADSATDSFYAQTIADSMPHQWNLTVGPTYPNATTGWDSKVYPLGHPLTPPAVGHETGAGAGGVNTAAYPTAIVIRHVVDRRGRGSQSRTSISPVVQTNIDGTGQNVIPGFITGLTDEFENFIAGVQADFATAVPDATLDYVQLSRKGAGATYPILRSFVEQVVGSERSRTLRP